LIPALHVMIVTKMALLIISLDTVIIMNNVEYAQYITPLLADSNVIGKNTLSIQCISFNSKSQINPHYAFSDIPFMQCVIQLFVNVKGLQSFTDQSAKEKKNVSCVSIQRPSDQSEQCRPITTD